MKGNHSRSISISVLIVFLLFCSNIFATESTALHKQAKSKEVKSVKGDKSKYNNAKRIQTKSKGSKSIQRKGQKEAGVLVEPTGLEKSKGPKPIQPRSYPGSIW